MTKFSCWLVVALFVVLFGGCGPTLKMQNINSGLAASAVGEVSENKTEMLILPHQTLGLEPTPAICRGNISTFLVTFPKRLLGGEYFLGTLRWNTWTVKDDKTEAFGQILFSGMHPSGDYIGTEIIDGQDGQNGQTAILSTDLNFIYNSFDGKELSVEREKFQTDPVYRRKKIQEVNKLVDGGDFKISSLTKVEGFQDVIKSWNQIQFPEGHLLSPYGVDEIAMIRGMNPQYSYFQKLVGTGQFTVRAIPHPVGFAIVNALGVAMDLIRATGAPSMGRDFSSIVSRRDQSFATEYLLALAEKEIKLRNDANAQLLQEARNAPRREP